MKRWNRTTMVWDCFLGLGTNIEVDDWKDDTPQVHTLIKATAVAEMDQKGVIKLTLRRVSIGPTTKKEEILKRLQTIASVHYHIRPGAFACHIQVVRVDDYSGEYLLKFQLSQNASFCDEAISLIRSIYTGLEIEHAMNRLADFEVTQDTLVWMDYGWITFANWLRINHGLRPQVKELVQFS